MRHYEIVLLIHPNQSKSNQAEAMIQRYKAMITDADGKIHRFEDWGRRHLAYTISKVHKAHYFLFNIECNEAVLKELGTAFTYNDAVIRSLILKKSKAITEPSPLAKRESQAESPRTSTKPPEATVAPVAPVAPVAAVAAPVETQTETKD